MAPTRSNPYSFDSGALDTLGALSLGIDTEMETKKKEYDNLLLQSLQPSSMSQENALLQGILQLAPLLLGGALAGRKGAIAGGTAGVVGGQNFATEAKKKGETEKLLAKSKAETIADELKELRGQKRTLEGKGIDIQSREATAGQKAEWAAERGNKANSARIRAAEIGVTQGAPLTDSQIDDITKRGETVARVRDTIDFIKNTVPQDVLNINIYKKDGTIDWDQAAKLGTSTFEEWANGANIPAGEARAQVKRMLTDEILTATGTAGSNKERNFLISSLTGDGAISPATWAVMLKVLGQVAEEKERHIKTKYEGIQRFRNRDANVDDYIKSLRGGGSAGSSGAQGLPQIGEVRNGMRVIGYSPSGNILVEPE